MRTFTSEDGVSWVAKLHDGLEPDPPADQRAGWEVVQFDAGTTTRITYRPSGWLANATVQELLAALREGENVRTVWKS